VDRHVEVYPPGAVGRQSGGVGEIVEAGGRAVVIPAADLMQEARLVEAGQGLP
jgi:hypothetical protein